MFYLRNVVFEARKVHESIGVLPGFSTIDVSNPERFLNDLMLSPFWKVERERDGSFVAKARSIGRDSSSDGEASYLFEFMARKD